MFAIVEDDWADEPPSAAGHLTAVHQVLQLGDLDRALKPVFMELSAFILQEDYLLWVVATHLSVGVVDDAVLVVSAEEFQATLLYRLDPSGDFFRPVLCLRKQIDQIRYFLALSAG